MEKDFEEFVVECENKIFQTEKFKAIGKGDDYIFQVLAFAGNGSHQISVATTILSELDEVPEEFKSELKAIQDQLHDFKDKLRALGKDGIK